MEAKEHKKVIWANLNTIPVINEDGSKLAIAYRDGYPRWSINIAGRDKSVTLAMTTPILQLIAESVIECAESPTDITIPISHFNNKYVDGVRTETVEAIGKTIIAKENGEVTITVNIKLYEITKKWVIKEDNTYFKVEGGSNLFAKAWATLVKSANQHYTAHELLKSEYEA